MLFRTILSTSLCFYFYLKQLIVIFDNKSILGLNVFSYVHAKQLGCKILEFEKNKLLSKVLFI